MGISTVFEIGYGPFTLHLVNSSSVSCPQPENLNEVELESKFQDSIWAMCSYC